MPDHIHMLVSIPPKMSVSSFMGYLKGKSALMIFDKHDIHNPFLCVIPGGSIEQLYPLSYKHTYCSVHLDSKV